MIFGIDIDDTISNTYEVIMAYAQEYTINFLKREPLLREELDCTNHMYAQYLHMWNDSDDKEFLANYYERLINNVRPKTLALEYLNKIHDEGNKIIIITARWKNDYFDVVEATKRWLERYNIPYDELITDADDKVGILVNLRLDIIQFFRKDAQTPIDIILFVGRLFEEGLCNFIRSPLACRFQYAGID